MLASHSCPGNVVLDVSSSKGSWDGRFNKEQRPIWAESGPLECLLLVMSWKRDLEQGDQSCIIISRGSLGQCCGNFFNISRGRLGMDVVISLP